MPFLSIFFLTILLLIFLLGEYFLLQTRRNRIPVRILVNGTRGKSTTVSILWDILRASGYAAYARTTGDKPVLYYPDGRRRAVRRFAPPRILEIRRLLNKWGDGNAGAAIMECMALEQENQFVLGRRIFDPTHVLITNITNDHDESMGPHREDKLQAILNCIPQTPCHVFAPAEVQHTVKYGTLYTPDAGAGNAPDRAFTNIPRQIIDENFALIAALAQQLDLRADIVRDCFIRKWNELDTEIRQIDHNGQYEFWNLFSVNDSVTADLFLDHIKTHSRPGYETEIIFNARSDRPLRSQHFVQLLVRRLPQAKIWLTGTGCALVKKLFRQNNAVADVVITHKQFLINRINSGFARQTVLLGMVNHAGMEDMINTLPGKTTP